MVRSPPSLHAPAVPSRRSIHLRWLLTLRWFSIGSFGLLLLAAWLLFDWQLSLPMLLGLLVIEAASNLLLVAWTRRSHELPERGMAAVIIIDVAVLTVLLAYASGSLNPFTSLYLLHIAIAAMVLRPLGTGAVVVVCLIAYGMLTLNQPHMAQAPHLQMHLAGMWAAFAITGPLLAVSLVQIRRALDRYDTQLAEAHAQAERNHKLISLATLAAGAAHELATPLGTIAVVARELELRGARIDARIFSDAQLVRQEVDRCTAILRQLSVSAGEGTGETAQSMTVRDLLRRSIEGTGACLEESDALEISLHVPPDLLRRALRGLVRNAVLASAEVTVQALQSDRAVEVRITDAGPGIPAALLDRIGEPFFTTRPVGQGMGLGVFFAREVCRALGGDVWLTSTEGAGTTAHIQLPFSHAP